MAARTADIRRAALGVAAATVSTVLAFHTPAAAEDACVQVYQYPNGSPGSTTYHVDVCRPTPFFNHGVGHEQPVGGTTYGVRVTVPAP